MVYKERTVFGDEAGNQRVYKSHRRHERDELLSPDSHLALVPANNEYLVGRAH